MRKLLSSPLVSAVIGGGATAGVLLAVGVVGAERTRTVYEQSPLSNVADTGEPALTAQAIYRRDAPGVAFVQASVLAPSASPFDPYGTDTTESTGSGFVLDDEGRILTNAHVVANATRVTVTLGGDTTRSATVIGKDDATDLALLEIDSDGLDLRPLELGNSSAVQVGDPTVAIGNPFGFDRTLTTGVVSALQRRITAPDGYTIEDVIQTDAAINPGNSGGPLIDASGRVIGINSQIATGGATGSVGIGFAVPVNTAREVVRELIAHGRVERPWMGVELVAVEPGMLVDSVYDSSPAAAAAIAGGDVITSVAGQPVASADDLRGALATHEPGDTIEVQLRRDEQPLTVQLTLANQPAGTPDG